MKRCSRCKQAKPLDAFTKNRNYPDGLQPQCKSCRAENHHAYYQANRERLDKYTRSWRQENPALLHAQLRNARAHRYGSAGTIAAAEWEALKKQFHYVCLGCNRHEPEITLTLDHVIPLVLGGPNSIDNAQPLCRACNARKNTKTTDYRKRLGRGAHKSTPAKG